ncbi:MAG TPA: hypothetical protein VMS76_00390, partial [Planctomycetota bacterium]|nr:hypothetical protein [Planctomycetota bacterium]
LREEDRLVAIEIVTARDLEQYAPGGNGAPGLDSVLVPAALAPPEGEDGEEEGGAPDVEDAGAEEAEE